MFSMVLLNLLNKNSFYKKIVPKRLPLLLRLFFSHSLSSSLIPTSFKEAAINPVFKSGDKSLPSNYRPIFLTSVLSKIIEKLFVSKSSLS